MLRDVVLIITAEVQSRDMTYTCTWTSRFPGIHQSFQSPLWMSPSPAFFFFFKFYFIFKLYIIVLVLPSIKMNPPQVYMCAPPWTLLPPPSPYHPSRSTQCTSPKHPVSCILFNFLVRLLAPTLIHHLRQLWC